MTLEGDFKKTFEAAESNVSLINAFWQEIVLQHSHKSRHYHSFHHLESIWQQLQPVKNQIQDWPVIVCAIAYHDFIYDTKSSRNEEKSAEKAVTKMLDAGFEANRANRCYKHIVATKGHQVSEDPDTNFFTDADLSILGSDEETYKTYTTNIRKEYRLFPDFMYKPGRKKVLQHFLYLPKIFKTEHFFTLYEEQARRNIKRELNSL
jgi:predicted metal-dependent HD superfamily phosphohydrolase